MTDDCITIESSGEEDDVQIMDTPTNQIESEPSEEIRRKVPLQSVETGKSIFTALLSACKKADSSSEMDIIVNKMWKRFHLADSSYTSSAKFIEFVKTLLTKATTEPFCQLKSVSDDLKFHKIVNNECPAAESVPPNTSAPSNSSESDQKTIRTIRKLEKLVAKLKRKIDHLESQEVDLNNSSEEEDSAYIQVCRYKKRICDVYKKICELRKSDDDGLYGSVRFSGTKIPAVNRAIERYYNDKQEFPDFREVLNIIEKANNLKDLRLLPQECHEIAEQAFKELGETLKRKRQFDFHESITSYIESSTCDPATGNQILEEKLEENRKLYGNRIDEIIDKYAKKQIEDKLEPEEVPDDIGSETSGEEEESEKEEDVSSIAEVESNGHESNEADSHHTSENADPEIPFEARDCKVVIQDVRQLPDWSYISPQRARSSPSRCNGSCEPKPGCSKDIVDDFCVSCSSKSSATPTKRRLVVVSDESSDDDSNKEIESRAKVAKVARPQSSVDLTDDSKSTEPATKTTKSLPKPSCRDVKDPLRVDKVESVRVPNGSANELSDSASASKSESLKPEPFVVVDVKSILSKGNKVVKSKAKNGGQSVESLSSKTESMVTRDETADKDVSIKDHLEVLSRNGIKIVSVSSVKDTSSSPPSDEKKNAGLTDSAKDESKVEPNSKLNASDIKNSEVIDLREVECRDQTIIDPVPQFVTSNEPKNSISLSSKVGTSNSSQNSNSLFHRSNSHQETKKTQVIRPPWTKCVPNYTNNKFPVTSTPKPNISSYPKLNSGGFSPLSSNRPYFTSRGSSHSISPRGPISQGPRINFNGPHYPNQNTMSGPRASHNTYSGPRAAMAKRTTQTTQKIVKGNNIYTQTTTVVQESMLQMVSAGGAAMQRNAFNSNGQGPVRRGGQSNHRFRGTSGSRFTTQPRSFTSNYGGNAGQNPRRQMSKNSSDIITLD